MDENVDKKKLQLFALAFTMVVVAVVVLLIDWKIKNDIITEGKRFSDAIDRAKDLGYRDRNSIVDRGVGNGDTAVAHADDNQATDIAGETAGKTGGIHSGTVANP